MFMSLTEKRSWSVLVASPLDTWLRSHCPYHDVDVADRKCKLGTTHDHPHAAIALNNTGHISEPPGIDVDMLVYLPGMAKRGEYTVKSTHRKNIVHTFADRLQRFQRASFNR